MLTHVSPNAVRCCWRDVSAGVAQGDENTNGEAQQTDGGEDKDEEKANAAMAIIRKIL